MSEYTDMKERIDKQREHADALVLALDETSEETVNAVELLDALARVGLELRPLQDHNIPSYAYFVCLGMNMDTLIDQLDIEVP